MSTASSLFFFHYFSLLCSSIKSDEFQILLTFKTALQNSYTNVFDSWIEPNSVCKFTGITCDPGNSVKEIELSNRNLTGVLPLDSICNLQYLDKLSLGFNSLSGTIMPDLNACTKLQYLDLGNNLFSGQFPQFSALTQLQHLYLNQSGFSGVFPWDSLLNTTNLVTLSVGDNPFDPTPFPSQIVKLVKLNWLYLANCSLEGEIPADIGNLSELLNFEVSDNNLSGEIPTQIGKLTKLWQLEMYNNSLTGKLPVGIGNLTKLEKFDASLNYLLGDLSELRSLSNLVTLQLFYNEFTGEIPPEFGEFKKLVNLSLYGNKLTGPVPQQLGSWTDFDYIDVSENYLTGTIPPDMCKQGTMRELLMLQNNLTGDIPATYANCTTLQRFRVSQNLLTGRVPAGIWGLPNVDIIDLDSNQLEGGISREIGKAKALKQLFAGDNQFSGELAEEITQATSLYSIQLNNNQFSGDILDSIGELKQLNNLYLQNNRFSGSLPDSLGSCNSLTDLNLANNFLSGEIPSSLGSLPTLNALNLSGNQFSGQIPGTLSSLKLSLLDLTNNKLTGYIPQSLSMEAYNGSFNGNPGLCSETVSNFRRSKLESRMSSRDVRTLIACLAVGAVILILSLEYLLYLKNKEENIHQDSLKKESWDVKSFHVLTFSEDEILDSIKEENLIGKGGSGKVYRVLLAKGTELAVKHISKKSEEFDSEVETLSSIRHVNVVKLYCSITSEKSSLLVYEYMSNGSLWDRLHASQKMDFDWETRYEIAVEATKGLEYLHHGCERPIIHRDVKSSNILLDEKPRIADFGLAKIANKDTTSTNHVIAGTHGYIAPEYGYTNKVNEKSDVYSFGVVLMELVSGKRPIEPEFGDNKDIVDWVASNLKSKESVVSIVDSKIPEIFKEDAVKLLRIAILCTTRNPLHRPTMRSIVQMLEDAKPCKLVNIVICKDGAGKKMAVTTKEMICSDS